MGYGKTSYIYCKPSRPIISFTGEYIGFIGHMMQYLSLLRTVSQRRGENNETIRQEEEIKKTAVKRVLQYIKSPCMPTLLWCIIE